MIRRSLTGGLALALLLGLSPSLWVLAASLAPKVCRMDCAGTAACCCNPRPAPASPSERDRGPGVMTAKLAPTCRGQCAVGSSGVNTAPHAVSGEISGPAPDLDVISSEGSLTERAGSRSAASRCPRAPPAARRAFDS